MNLLKMSMPDGEVRLYCSRISQIISYFADDGDGGSVLWLEAAEMAVVQDSTMDDVRVWILDEVAKRLCCHPSDVETFPITTLCRKLRWRPEPPRHPWQVKSCRHHNRAKEKAPEPDLSQQSSQQAENRRSQPSPRRVYR